MATTDKESSAAGTNNRPPMLEESDFESWKIRIERYIRGKPLGKLIWKSIKNGPTPHPTITVTTGEGVQQTQKETLFDQYERFRANGNESIHDYFVRFHKLINDMKITKMEIPVHQRNTKFFNNLPSYWGKYVTIVKKSKDMSTVSYVDLYTCLKSYEQHAMKTLSKMKQTFGNANPLTYIAQATQSTSSPSQYVPPPPQYAPALQQAPQLTNDAMLATMNQIITTESVQRRAPGNKGKHAATGSQGKLVTYVECTTPYAEPLAITTTTTFEVSHEDVYDSDVDEAPHAAAAFMANLMQTGPSTGQGTSNDTDFHSEVHTYDNNFFDNMNLQVSQKIHREEQLDSDVDSVIDDHDNTIPYHQYQLNNEVKSVPTDVSSVIPSEISVITILDDFRSQLEDHIKINEEQSFANDSLKAELERYKTQVVTELLQSYGQPVQIVPMLSKRPTFSTKDLHKYAFGHRNPWYLKLAQLCRPTLYLGDVIVDPIHTPLRVYDSEETLVQAEVSRTKMLERMKDSLCKVSSKPINYAKLNNMYDTFVPQKQLSREQVYWLPANEVASYNCNQSKPLDKEYDQCVIDKKSFEIKNKNLLIQNECLLVESVSKDICSVVLTSDIDVPMSIEPSSSCVKEHFRNMELEAEILKVKQLLVEKEKRCSFIETEYQLKEELTTVRIKNDSLRDENVSIKKRYQDFYQSKAKSNSNVSSKAVIPEKPKVVAPGLYAMTPKNLPARSENMKRVDNTLRSLNKRNRVYSSLSVKRNGFISKSVSVCNICNECLVFGNHNKCGVKNLNSMNAKNPKVKNDAIVKQVWKATGKIFPSVGSKWRPTGRKFTLGDTCPLTRITKPEVVPLEKSGSVSTSEPANNVIVTPRFSKKPLTSYERKDRKIKDTSTGSPPNAETKVVNNPVNANDLSANQQDPNKIRYLMSQILQHPQFLNAGRTDRPLAFGLRLLTAYDRSELKIHDHSNKPSSLKLVPKVVPPADKTDTSRQELELLFHHHITMLRKVVADSVAERLEQTTGCFFRQTDLSL
ncbi:hypothetical protein Tco_0595000 [Tanacetum coccineum]